MSRHNDPLFSNASGNSQPAEPGEEELESCGESVNNEPEARSKVVTLSAPDGKRHASHMIIENAGNKPRNIQKEVWHREQALNVFQLLLCKSNEREMYSNVLDVWELLPRFTGEEYNINKRSRKFPSQLNIKFNFSGRMLHIVQTPGRYVERRDEKGNEYVKVRYPGNTEHLVEQAIIKLAIQQAFLEDEEGASTPNYSLNFTLRSIEKELKKMGVARNINDIKMALDVLATSVISIRDETPGRAFDYEEKTTFITSLRRISLSDKGSTNTSAGVYNATLNRIVAHGINVLGYRQYRTDFAKNLNYFGAYIYRRMLVDQLNLSTQRGFTFLFSEIQSLTFGLNDSRITNSLKRLTKELDKMVEQGVISSYIKNEIKSISKRSGRSVLSDAEIEIFPSSAVISEIKKSHLKTGVAADALGMSMDNHNQIRLQLPMPPKRES
ncbi:hypothetical protein [Halomonas casei]|uniref:hypothetical protein n=1 Tax=Halomonas casei TaxID=2742613 RepID=UPI003CF75C5F